jgi:hypothetical protein
LIWEIKFHSHTKLQLKCYLLSHYSESEIIFLPNSSNNRHITRCFKKSWRP